MSRENIINKLAKEVLDSEEGLDTIKKIKIGVCDAGLLSNYCETTEEYYNCSSFENELNLAYTHNLTYLYNCPAKEYDPELEFRQSVYFAGGRQLERKIQFFVNSLKEMTWAEVARLHNSMVREYHDKVAHKILDGEPVQIGSNATIVNMTNSEEPDTPHEFASRYIDGDKGWTHKSHEMLHEALIALDDCPWSWQWTEGYAVIDEKVFVTPYESTNEFSSHKLKAELNSFTAKVLRRQDAKKRKEKEEDKKDNSLLDLNREFYRKTASSEGYRRYAEYLKADKNHVACASHAGKIDITKGWNKLMRWEEDI